MADLTVSADVDAMMASANNAAIISNIGAASLSGNQTFTGDQSFSGQVEATGQAASTDDSVMTRSLGDTRYGYQLAGVSTSNQALTNTTAATDVTSLACSLTPGTWEVETLIYFDVASTTPGAQFLTSFDGTSTAYRGHTYTIYGGSSTVDQAGFQTAVGSIYLYPGNPTGSSLVNHKATIVVSVAGTFKIRFRQWVSSGDALTVYSPSRLICTKIT